MRYDCVTIDGLRLMEKYLLQGDEKLLQNLTVYGEITGKLSKAAIFQMWNGSSLDKFSVPELRALFEFLNEKFNIGDIDDYFAGDKVPTDRKQVYLEAIDDPERKRVEGSVLRRVGVNMEDIFERDICEMSEGELIAGLSNMGYVNRRVAQNELIIIRRFLDWCYNKGYYTPAKNIAHRISVDDIELKKSLWYSLVPTPEKLREIIDAVCDSSRVNNDGVIICLHWLGLNAEEVHNLLADDVDLIGGSIKHGALGEIKIPDVLLKFLRDYRDNDIIYGEIYSYVADKTEYFLHRFARKGVPFKGERLSLSTIRLFLTRFKKLYEEASGKKVKFTGTTLRTSGACWRLYNREMSGETLTDEIFSYEFQIEGYLGLKSHKDIYNQYKEIFYGV